MENQMNKIMSIIAIILSDPSGLTAMDRPLDRRVDLNSVRSCPNTPGIKTGKIFIVRENVLSDGQEAYTPQSALPPSPPTEAQFGNVLQNNLVQSKKRSARCLSTAQDSGSFSEPKATDRLPFPGLEFDHARFLLAAEQAEPAQKRVVSPTTQCAHASEEKQTVPNNQLLCPECGEFFIHLHLLNSHILSRHAICEPYKCKIDSCTFKTAYITSFKRHAKQIHNQKSRIYLSLTDQKNAAKKLRPFLEKKNWKVECPVCTLLCPSHESMKTHQSWHERKPSSQIPLGKFILHPKESKDFSASPRTSLAQQDKAGIYELGLSSIPSAIVGKDCKTKESYKTHSSACEYTNSSPVEDAAEGDTICLPESSPAAHADFYLEIMAQLTQEASKQE